MIMTNQPYFLSNKFDDRVKSQTFPQNMKVITLLSIYMSAERSQKVGKGYKITYAYKRVCVSVLKKEKKKGCMANNGNQPGYYY